MGTDDVGGGGVAVGAGVVIVGGWLGRVDWVDWGSFIGRFATVIYTLSMFELAAGELFFWGGGGTLAGWPFGRYVPESAAG